MRLKPFWDTLDKNWGPGGGGNGGAAPPLVDLEDPEDASHASAVADDDDYPWADGDDSVVVDEGVPDTLVDDVAPHDSQMLETMEDSQVPPHWLEDEAYAAAMAEPVPGLEPTGTEVPGTGSSRGEAASEAATCGNGDVDETENLKQEVSTLRQDLLDKIGKLKRG